jgi:transcriptional repressor NrdR
VKVCFLLYKCLNTNYLLDSSLLQQIVEKRFVTYNIEYVMICPFCGDTTTKVTDKRDTKDVTRRRRECVKCKKRFTTYERAELDLFVIKKDGHRVPYNREKISGGIRKACEKRPVSSEKIQKMIDEIEAKLRKRGKEVKSSYIGGLVMNRLKKLDRVAYIRFASVYQDFKDVDDFKKEIKELG